MKWKKTDTEPMTKREKDILCRGILFGIDIGILAFALIVFLVLVIK